MAARAAAATRPVQLHPQVAHQRQVVVVDQPVSQRLLQLLGAHRLADHLAVELDDDVVADGDDVLPDELEANQSVIVPEVPAAP